LKKIKILADENIGGELLDDVQKILGKKLGIEVIPFPEELRRKSLNDEEILDKLKELECDGIVSRDDGMIKRAIERGLKAFWLLGYRHGKVYIVCEVKMIGGVRISKEYFWNHEE